HFPCTPPGRPSAQSFLQIPETRLAGEAMAPFGKERFGCGGTHRSMPGTIESMATQAVIRGRSTCLLLAFLRPTRTSCNGKLPGSVLRWSECRVRGRIEVRTVNCSFTTA